MPKIQWSNLPSALRQHLFDRVAERQITAEDLYQLKLWRESGPEAPWGLWYKDFGSFKICGEGKYPKTFLLRGQAARGDVLRFLIEQHHLLPKDLADVFGTPSHRIGGFERQTRIAQGTDWTIKCPLPRVARTLLLRGARARQRKEKLEIRK
jgi:hypothetical protein